MAQECSENHDMTSTREMIRVIIFREGDFWVAQCLEYDIGTQAKDLDELQAQFELTFRVELKESVERNGEAFKGIPPAPPHFHKMWENRAGDLKPVHERPADLPIYDMALCA